jgi:uncharacterized protein YbjT (DUF2867 family)
MAREASAPARRILITALPPSRLPGAVPSAPAGRELARLLVARGHRVVALVPGSEASGWPGEVEVVRGTVTRPWASPEAFVEVDAVFLGGLASLVPNRLRELTNLLLASGRLRRAVVLASHGRDFETEHSDETWPWLAFERALDLAGAAWTYVIPGGLFANALVGGYPISGSDWARAIRSGGPLREYRAGVRYPFTDEQDLANVVARLLGSREYAGTRLDVIGCLASAEERLAAWNAALGTSVELVPLTDQAEARAYWAGQGWPETTIEVTFYATDVFAASPAAQAQVEASIERTAGLLGRSPQTFTDWARRNAPHITATAAPPT